jgi:hypothetical protein
MEAYDCAPPFFLLRKCYLLGKCIIFVKSILESNTIVTLKYEILKIESVFVWF